MDTIQLPLEPATPDASDKAGSIADGGSPLWLRAISCEWLLAEQCNERDHVRQITANRR
jgi:hypothetical protein